MEKKLTFTRYIWFVDQARRGRHPNTRTLAAKFEISQVQAQRDLEFMRERLFAPLVYRHAERGWELEGDHFALPTVWIDGEELLLLAVAKELIRDPDAKRILNDFFRKVVPTNCELDVAQVEKVISFKGMGFYRHLPGVLWGVMQALLGGHRLAIRFRDVFTPGATPCWCEVAPLHLIFYRSNWYLMARAAAGLRTYSLARVDAVRVLPEPHRDPLDEEAIHRQIEATFGIFITDQHRKVVRVRLRFPRAMAGFIETVVYHPRQKMTLLADGGVEVSFPSTVNRELVGEVLRFADQVEIVAPAELRRQVRAALEQGLRNIGK